MNNLLEILDKHKNKEIVSYQMTFAQTQILIINFKDGSNIKLCEYTKK
jgi:hypothetical protein